MIELTHGPLISQPGQWVVVFDPVATNRLVGWLTPGRFKHVRAYGYVPFLHVWLFVDANFAGIEIRLAAEGAAAEIMVAAWTDGCDLVLMPRFQHANRSLLAAGCGWCVPTVKRLIGLRSSALRPDALLADCLAHDGKFLRTYADAAGAAGSRHRKRLGRRWWRSAAAWCAGAAAPAGGGDQLRPDPDLHRAAD